MKTSKLNNAFHSEIKFVVSSTTSIQTSLSKIASRGNELPYIQVLT